MKWENHNYPSWENLALILKKMRQYKHAEVACQERAGKAFYRFANTNWIVYTYNC